MFDLCQKMLLVGLRVFYIAVLVQRNSLSWFPVRLRMASHDDGGVCVVARGVWTQITYLGVKLIVLVVNGFFSYCHQPTSLS